MSTEPAAEPQLPNPGRRALVVWYDDDANTVDLDAEAFSWLEVPELLRAALDIAELYLPTPACEPEESESE